MNFFYFLAHFALPFFTSGLIALPSDFPISFTTASPSSWAAIAWSSCALKVFSSYKSSKACAEPPSSGLSYLAGGAAAFFDDALAADLGFAVLVPVFGGALVCDKWAPAIGWLVIA